MTTTDEINWNVILDGLNDGDLIPVIGPELLWVDDGSYKGSYRLWLATRLAKGLHLTVDGLENEKHPVEEVMLRYYNYRNGGGVLPYQLVKALINEDKFPTPEAVRKLAQIKKFRFFLTTTYEPFLEMAVKKAWGMGDSQIRILENNLVEKPDDINCFDQESEKHAADPRYVEKLYNNSAPPSIYYLYGRPSRMKSYALSEDDVLEANLMLHSSMYRPDNLIRFLSGKRLLILGCNFNNWLARFFIALTSPDRRNKNEQPVFVMGDSVCQEDQNLASYLKRIDAQVFRDSTIQSFVDQLYQKWMESGYAKMVFQAVDKQFEERSIFISYASEDSVAANHVFEEIRAAGLPVWLDKNDLKAGKESYDSIEYNIRNCSIFIPLISPDSCIGDFERVYRQEWKMVIDLLEMPDTTIVIMPVMIGPVHKPGANIPLAFSKLHWMDAPDGDISDKDLIELKKTFEKILF